MRTLLAAALGCIALPLFGQEIADHSDFRFESDPTDGALYARWNTEPGYLYWIRSSDDLSTWDEELPHYGSGNQAELFLQSGSTAGGGGGNPPDLPVRRIQFMLAPFENGQTRVSWTDASDGLVRALINQDYANTCGGAAGTTITSGGEDVRLDVLSLTGAAPMPPSADLALSRDDLSASALADLVAVEGVYADLRIQLDDCTEPTPTVWPSTTEIPRKFIQLVRQSTDTDGDNLFDHEEFGLGTDPFRADTDGDGIPDDAEIAWGTNPLTDDEDGDGTIDLLADRDGDGMTAAEELSLGTSDAPGSGLDSDFDGVLDCFDAVPHPPIGRIFTHERKPETGYVSAILPEPADRQLTGLTHIAINPSGTVLIASDVEGAYRYNVLAPLEAPTEVIELDPSQAYVPNPGITSGVQAVTDIPPDSFGSQRRYEPILTDSNLFGRLRTIQTLTMPGGPASVRIEAPFSIDLSGGVTPLNLPPIPPRPGPGDYDGMERCAFDWIGVMKDGTVIAEARVSWFYIAGPNLHRDEFIYFLAYPPSSSDVDVLLQTSIETDFRITVGPDELLIYDGSGYALTPPVPGLPEIQRTPIENGGRIIGGSSQSAPDFPGAPHSSGSVIVGGTSGNYFVQAASGNSVCYPLKDFATGEGFAGEIVAITDSFQMLASPNSRWEAGSVGPYRNEGPLFLPSGRRSMANNGVIAGSVTLNPNSSPSKHAPALWFPADIDIDADNNNGFELPGRTGTEERSESDAWGKIILATEGDTDSDGVPDYADGFTDLFSGEGRGANGLVPECAPLTPVTITVAPFGESYSTTTIQLSYAMSDPAGLGDASTKYSRNGTGGTLRLWKRDRSKQRVSHKSILNGGDLVPSGEPITPSTLGISASNQTVTLYLEAENHSQNPLNVSLTVSHHPNLNSQFQGNRIKVSPVSIQLEEYDSDGSQEFPSVKTTKASHPSPTVEANSLTVASLQSSADGGSIEGSLVADGIVLSEVCDFVRQQDGGQITSASIYLNDIETAIATIPITFTKGSATNPLAAPFPYVGGFNFTLPGIKWAEGTNLIRIEVVDPVTDAIGFTEHIVEVLGTHPASAEPDLPPDNYLNSTFVAGSAVVAHVSDPGELHTYLWRLKGPNDLLESLAYIETADGPRRLFQTSGKWYVKMKNSPPLRSIVTLWDIARDDSLTDEQKMLAFLTEIGDSLSDELQFRLGFVHGAWDGGASMIEGGFQLLKFVLLEVGSQSLRWSAPGIVWRFRNGEAIQSEFQAFQADAQSVANFAQFVWDAYLTGAQFQIDLLTGDGDLYDGLGDTMKEVGMLAAELFEAMAAEVVTSSPREKGYFLGRVAFEVATLYVGWTKLGKLGTVGKITKGRFLNELKTLSWFQSGKAQAALARLNGLVGRFLSTQVCFVAGTLVHTSNGLLPIEEVKVGDNVWSANPELSSMQPELKPVTATITTHPDRLYHLLYETEGGISETLVSSGEHPFYVSNRAPPQFVTAEELIEGDSWVLRSGESATLATVRTEDASDEEMFFTTYNIEVADNHTYYVGEPGVWVHNASPASCQRVLAIFDTFTKRNGDDIWAAFASARGRISRVANGDLLRLKLINHARAKYFNDFPNGLTPPPWLNLSIQLRPSGVPYRSSRLTTNLERVFGFPKPKQMGSHHIVEKAANSEGRLILEAAEMHLDEAANGVWLKTSAMEQRFAAQGRSNWLDGLGVRHNGSHTAGYREAVNARLRVFETLPVHPVNERALALRNELQVIAKELTEGTFTWP